MSNQCIVKLVFLKIIHRIEIYPMDNSLQHLNTELEGFINYKNPEQNGGKWTPCPFTPTVVMKKRHFDKLQDS